jgi:hypothetical protein
MRTLNRGLLCTCCALALGLPTAAFAQSQSSISSSQIEVSGQTAQGDRPTRSTNSAESLTASAELPDSPGASQAENQNAAAPQNPSSGSTNPSNSQGSVAPQQGSASTAAEQQKPQRPVGTAAAEAPKVSGITAAEPAGIAIAPAKQHRTRAIVIKVGAIIAAGAAVGAVVALTEATPSKPPGAH